MKVRKKHPASKLHVAVSGDDRLAKDRQEAKAGERVAELRSPQEKSTDLIKRAPTAIYEVDFHGPRFKSVNDQMCEATGYTREELLAMDPFDLLEAESKARFRERIRKQLAGEKIGDLVEYRGKAKDGREMVWVMKVAFTYDADGRPEGAIVVGHDITERKLAEGALADSEELYRLLAEAAEDFIYVVNPDMTIAFLNQAGAASLGVSPEKIVGKHLSEVFPKETYEHFDRNLKAIFGSGTPMKDLHNFIFPDKNFWLHVKLTPIKDKDGRVVQVLGISRDITERVRAEQALRESEAKFRSLIEQSSEAFILIDEAGRITEYNKAAEQIYGYAAEEIVGMYFWDMASLMATEEERKAYTPGLIEKNIKKYLATGKSFSGNQYRETIAHCKDGSVRYVQITDFPVKTAKGYIIGNIVSDITERKLADIALRESEEKFRSLIEQASEGFVLADESGKVIEYNKAAEQIYGYAAEEIIGMYFWDMAMLIIDEKSRKIVDPEMIRKSMQEYLATGNGIGSNRYRETVVRCKDGSSRYVQTLDFPVKTAKGYMIGNIVSDITERKRAEIALLESEEKFRALAESTNAGIVLFRGDRFIYGNPAMEKAMGYTKDEIVGMSYLDVVYPDMREMVRNIAIARQKGQAAPSTYEYKALTKSGETRWVEMSSTIIDYGGEKTGLATVFDVTERKRAEEELRESEEKFRALAETSLAAILVYQDENYVYVNPSAERITGYGAEELLRMKFWDIFVPGDQEMIRERGKARLQGGAAPPSRYEARYRAKDGREGVLEINASVTSYNGRRAGLVTALDVTDRKRAEEALKLTGYSLDNAGDIVIWFRPDGRIYYANNAACQQFGYTRDEMLALTIFDINPGYTAESWNARWQELKRKGSTLYEFENRARDGHRFPVEVANTYIKFGEQEFMFGYARDTTERKRAEEALRETRDYLESLINYANAPIIVWGPDFTITQFNRAFERLSGYRAEDVIGKNLRMLFPPGSVDESLGKIRSTLAGEHWESVEIPILRKDGGTRIALWNSANIRGEHGKLRATIAQGQDITERKRAEDELEVAKSQVELYLDLMSHDINNMHQIALGYLELLEDMEQGETAREFLGRSQDVLLRSARLIDNVRKLQKLREGGYKLGPVELVGILSDVLKEYNAVPGKVIALDTGTVYRGYVLANELLYDVFSNLVSNAIKHSGEHVEIRVRLEKIGGNGGASYRISVTDNGPGISDAFKEKVFNRLLQGDTKAKGMGLGLYLVKTLVESYGGRVWVEDRVKGDHAQGAKFIVELPALGNQA